MNRDKVLILVPGNYPMPPTRGGAVETLVQDLIEENERQRLLNITALSYYEAEAERLSERYQASRYLYVRIPKLVLDLDRLLFSLTKNLLKSKVLSLQHVFSKFYFIRHAGRLLHAGDFDKVVIENDIPLFWALKTRKNSAKYQNKYYLHLHNRVRKSFFCGKCAADSNKIITVSNFIRLNLPEFLKPAQASRTVVLKNCADWSFFQPGEGREQIAVVKKQYGILPDERILLFAGRIDESKGILQLLLAFQKLKSSHVKLMLAGSQLFGSGAVGPFQTKVKQLADTMPGKVIVTGYIPHDQICFYYQSADLAVLPSIWDDPAPLAVIEAMASGLPIITTDSGGIPEYVNPDCAVILKRDEALVGHLAEAIDSLLSDDKRREKMSDAARKAAKEYTPARYYEIFVHILSEETGEASWKLSL